MSRVVLQTTGISIPRYPSFVLDESVVSEENCLEPELARRFRQPKRPMGRHLLKTYVWPVSVYDPNTARVIGSGVDVREPDGKSVVLTISFELHDLEKISSIPH
jgi:hypothetical protein